MIKNLFIQNYKCIKKESFIFRPLTIISGVNSSGKTSVIQTILLILEYFGDKRFLEKSNLNFSIIKNRLINAQEININLDERYLSILRDIVTCSTPVNKKIDILNLDKEVFHIAEDRVGPEPLPKLSINPDTIGRNGEYIFSYYERRKGEVINNSFKGLKSKTLYANVDYWLSEILNESVILNSEEISEDNLKIYYTYAGITDISPKHLGAGVSYLAKIIIVCLAAERGTTVIIENPEIHLHPRAQAKIGEFFSYIASRSVQIIIETHCEHLINRIRYEEYKNNIRSEDIVIYYKKSLKDLFIEISIENGHFTQENKIINFPSGFFDSTLSELLEIS